MLSNVWMHLCNCTNFLFGWIPMLIHDSNDDINNNVLSMLEDILY